MPYEYRKLSPSEREEIVRYRQERGYPLHAPPHPFREAGYYLITAAKHEHAPIMDSPLRRTEFEIFLLQQTFNYIHYNPVKHGYTDDIIE
jgi:hypothetical protein